MQRDGRMICMIEWSGKEGKGIEKRKDERGYVERILSMDAFRNSFFVDRSALGN